MKKKKQTKKKTNQKVNENELLKVIDIISKKLAYKFKFGYHDIEDMKQQIWIFALEGLNNYDHKRPLENFLWTHVRNRLFNYKRDNYQRPDKPCLTCPLYDPKLLNSYSGCKQYENKNDCDLYSIWIKRNDTKKNLMYLTTIEEIKDYASFFFCNTSENADNNEILQILDEKLNDDYRIIYLKLKTGTKVSKSDQEKLTAKIKQILQDHYE
jgi:DNA-directed RNA polymerase specialized sigma24 family protein